LIYRYVDFFNPEILPESDNISQITEITGGTSIDTNMSDKPLNSDFKPQLNIFESLPTEQNEGSLENTQADEIEEQTAPTSTMQEPVIEYAEPTMNFIPQTNIIDVPKEKKPTIEDMNNPPQEKEPRIEEMEQKPVIEEMEEKPVKKTKKQKPVIEEMEQQPVAEAKKGVGRGSYLKKETIKSLADIDEIKTDALNYFEFNKQNVLQNLRKKKVQIDGIVDAYTALVEEAAEQKKKYDKDIEKLNLSFKDQSKKGVAYTTKETSIINKYKKIY
jgi:hypothetical protein